MGTLVGIRTARMGTSPPRGSRSSSTPRTPRRTARLRRMPLDAGQRRRRSPTSVGKAVRAILEEELERNQNPTKHQNDDKAPFDICISKTFLSPPSFFGCVCVYIALVEL